MIINKKPTTIDFPNSTRGIRGPVFRVKNITSQNRRLHSKSKNEASMSNNRQETNKAEASKENNALQITSTPNTKQSQANQSCITIVDGNKILSDNKAEPQAVSASLIESIDKENKKLGIENCKSSDLSESKKDAAKSAVDGYKDAYRYQSSLFNRDEAAILKKKKEDEKNILKDMLEKQIIEKQRHKDEQIKKRKEEEILETRLKECNIASPAVNKETVVTEKRDCIIPQEENIMKPASPLKEPETVNIIEQKIEVKEPIKELDEEYQATDKIPPHIGKDEWEDMKKKIEVLNDENAKLKNAISNIRERKNQSQEKIRPPLLNQRRIKISASANQKTVEERKKKEDSFINEIEALQSINERIQKANERKMQLQMNGKAQKLRNIRQATIKETKTKPMISSKVPLKQYILSQQQSKKDIQNSFTEGRNLDTVCDSKLLYPSIKATPAAEFEDELDLLIKNYGDKIQGSSSQSQERVFDACKTHSTSINLKKSLLQSPILTTAGSMSTAVPENSKQGIDVISKLGWANV